MYDSTPELVDLPAGQPQLSFEAVYMLGISNMEGKDRHGTDG